MGSLIYVCVAKNISVTILCIVISRNFSKIEQEKVACFGAGGFQVHRDGEVWAATLWDLRTQLGAAITDRLVLNGMRTVCERTEIEWSSQDVHPRRAAILITLPEPLAPDVIVMNELLLAAVQLQPADVVTVTLPVPPAAARNPRNFCLSPGHADRNIAKISDDSSTSRSIA